MERRIENYVKEIFKNAPNTIQAQELKAEILQNTIEKYNDLVADGKDEETAFSAAISSIGNINELIDEYSKDYNPEVLTAELRKHKARQALLLSIAVALYITCVVPVIIFGVLGEMVGSEYIPVIGLSLMFLMIALATGIIIYRGATAKLYVADEKSVRNVTYVEPKTKEERKRALVIKNIRSALWTLLVLIYLLVSFLTGAWHITWIIFIIGAVVENLLKAILDYKEWGDLESDDE